MFSRPIYFYKLFYMFQAVPPPITRSTKQYVQRQVLSNQYCCLLLLWMRWNSSSISSTIAAGSSIGFTIPDTVRTTWNENQLMSPFYSYIAGSLHVSGPQAHLQESWYSCSHNHWFSFCATLFACPVCCGLSW